MVKSDKKTNLFIMLILTAVYTASYLCRYSYAAVLPAMVESTGRTKTELSVAVTGLFVCYGVGQLVSGFLVDRLPPKTLILAGMLASCAFNLAVPFTDSLWAVRILWCLNGFAQAFFWPPIVAVMSRLLSGQEYTRGSVWVSNGGYIGTISLYLLAPVMIRIWSWKGLFIFSASAALLIAIVFALKFPGTPKPQRMPVNDLPAGKADRAVNDSCACEATDVAGTAEPAPQKKRRLASLSIITPTLLLIMFCIMIQGFIKDGTTTWMPTYISEMFRLDSGISILTGVLLPVFAIICLKLTSLLYSKKLTNPLVCAAALFGIGAVAALILFLVGGKVAALAVLFSAVLVGTMHGVNLMLICMIPPYFKESGNVGFAAGLLNFTTYVGSSASAYVLAAMSENMSWTTIFAILAGAAAIAGTVCFLLRGFRPKTSSGGASTAGTEGEASH